MVIAKDEIIKKIKSGELEALSPNRRMPFLKTWKYLKVIENGQPITPEEIAKQVGGNIRGVKAYLKKLEKKGKIVALFYKGNEYYLTKEYYDQLRSEGKKQ